MVQRRWEDRVSKLERLRVLYNISNVLTTTQRSEAILRSILKEAVKVTRATSGSLILIDRAQGVLNIQIADNIDQSRAARLKLRIGEGVTGWVAKTGRPLLVGDVRRSPHYVRIKTDVKSELAVPLIIGGEVVGVINVDSNKLNAFTGDDQDLLVAIAAQSGRVMHAAHLYEENRGKAERLATLFNVAGAVVSEPLLEDVLRRVTDEVLRLVGARVCSIVLLDDKGENFEIKSVSGEVSADYINRKRFPAAPSVIGQIIQTRKPLYVADVRKEKLYRLRRVARESGLCSLLAIPMVFLDKLIGVLNIYTAQPRIFSDEEIALMRVFAGHAAVAIINAQRYQRVFRSEELLRQAEKFSLLGTLSAEIAHEIRNPLTILSMLVHTVRADSALSKESKRDLGVMQTKLKHINNIVDQVLDFSRSQQGETVSANVNQIVEDVCMLVGHKAAAMNLRIRKHLRESLPPVLVDPGQIEQAVLNLAINGLEAMRDGGECLRISTGRSKMDGMDRVEIRVRDEGRGISEEKMQKIFTPYFSMRDRGTGLGLFISRRIITQHGGTLKVRSRVGRGTTFEILLPAADRQRES